MLKRIGLPIFALAALLLFAAPHKANAEVHFGVYVGGPPAYAYPADPYYGNSYDPYYQGYNGYPYPAYSYPAPVYSSPYSYGWRGHEYDEHREHENHERQERVEHSRHDGERGSRR